jgi:enoyl-CoA hydratase
MSDLPSVLFEVRNQVGWIKLNRPRAINALSLEMVESIEKQLHQWKEDDQVALILLVGEGNKGLCSGGDIGFLYNGRGTDREKTALPFLATEYRMDLAIHQYPKPILVYMNGIVMGGGVGISIGCKHRIVTEKTEWSMPEMNIGFFPDVGASYFFNRMPGYTGRYLALTASIIEAADVLYIKAADRFMPSDRWNDLKRALDEMKWTKGFITEQLNRLLDDFTSSSIPGSSIAGMQEKIDRHFIFNTMEEIIHSLSLAAEAEDPWAVETIKTLTSKSPTSLKVTLRQLQEGAGKSLEDCFRMELSLGLCFLNTHDFYEGVRAVIVDKDRNPKWSPLTIEELGEEYVSSFFQYPWRGKDPMRTEPLPIHHK